MCECQLSEPNGSKTVNLCPPPCWWSRHEAEPCPDRSLNVLTRHDSGRALSENLRPSFMNKAD